ncbi:hypothetical protein [Caenimonas koreensis]|uniref:Uncharacterized protein n=1 Tax=Caenimonas koreensis DSM 17982 TaxID=1121255 RepID=A0A844B8M5_9BURK|nr:hypothetical protein [Caenimonas koreensis]MRD49503.1 hypothetical protein [Caenimonas koreensis DSM 17982]
MKIELHSVAFAGLAMFLSGMQPAHSQAVTLPRALEAKTIKAIVEIASGVIPQQRDVEVAFGIKYGGPISPVGEGFKTTRQNPPIAHAPESTYLRMSTVNGVQIRVALRFLSQDEIQREGLPAFCIERDHLSSELAHKNWRKEIVTDPLHNLKEELHTARFLGTARSISVSSTIGPCVQTIVIQYN